MEAGSDADLLPGLDAGGAAQPKGGPAAKAAAEAAAAERRAVRGLPGDRRHGGAAAGAEAGPGTGAGGL